MTIANYRSAAKGVEALDAEGGVIAVVTPRGNPSGWSAYTDWLKQPDGQGGTNSPLPRVLPAPVTAADANYKAAAKQRVDDAAAMARAKFMTLSPGIESEYRAKFDEASEYLAIWPAVAARTWYFLPAEATQRGKPEKDVAEEIVAAGRVLYQVKLPAISAARVAGKEAIDDPAVTLRSEVDTLEADVIAALRLIANE